MRIKARGLETAELAREKVKPMGIAAPYRNTHLKAQSLAYHATSVVDAIFDVKVKVNLLGHDFISLKGLLNTLLM